MSLRTSTVPFRAHPSAPTAAPAAAGRVVLIPHGFETNYTVGFARGLAANGIRVLVVSADTDCRELDAAGIANVNLRGEQGPDRPPHAKAITLLRYYARLVRLLQRERGGTLHFTGLFKKELILLEGLLLHRIFRRLAGRYVYTAHNVLPHGCENRRFLRRMYRSIYRLPDRIIVHAPAAARQLLQEFGVPKEKVQVASIGLNEEAPLTELTRAEARERLGLAEPERVVLFFGKAEPYKGLDLLIRAHAAAEGPDATLLVSCWFPSADYRRAVLEAIARSPRRNRIRLHEGYAANEDVEVFFKAADVLVLPYRHIYQSGVVFLCWRFGLPVVATDVGSLREYIEPDAGVIAPAATPEAIARALRRFFDRGSRFRRERIAARAQRYRWEVICRDLLPLYRPPDHTV